MDLNSLAKERNTPTHVGKTRHIFLGPLNVKKHPHACGEDRIAPPDSRALPETPPRMWGRHNSPVRVGPNSGNTPTHVGKTNPAV